MTTLAEPLSIIKKPWQWMAVGGAVLLICAALALPRHNQRVPAAREAVRHVNESYTPPAAEFRSAPASRLMASVSQADASPMEVQAHRVTAGADVTRKIIRTSSLEVIVQHPAETAGKIGALAESMGGYLVSSDGGGQTATSGTLTIRVPAARFEEALEQIRKLGLRVEKEKVDAQDVTQQYVDQDANIRNLRAEEAQYLTILKRATTVKDMMVVSEQLSDVRGQIERQQAEFNALSRQIETVAISVSLRTESVEQVSELNWRPLYQLRLAMHDGLDSVADYATSMMTILFYLPAVLLWLGTILFAAFACWRIGQWVVRRWLSSKSTPATAQL